MKVKTEITIKAITWQPCKPDCCANLSAVQIWQLCKPDSRANQKCFHGSRQMTAARKSRKCMLVSLRASKSFTGKNFFHLKTSTSFMTSIHRHSMIQTLMPSLWYFWLDSTPLERYDTFCLDSTILKSGNVWNFWWDTILLKNLCTFGWMFGSLNQFQWQLPVADSNLYTTPSYSCHYLEVVSRPVTVDSCQ